MNNKLLTIVITAYNEEKYITRCIESIEKSLGEERNKVEIIVSNNNSTDKTVEIVEELKKIYSNIEIVTSTKKGPSVARNFGINVANGKFITFVDGDDYLDGNILKVLHIIEQNSSIELFQTTCSIHKNNIVLKPMPCKEEYFYKQLNFEKFVKNLKLNTIFSSSSSKIISLDVIRKNNLLYNENNMQMEDMEFGIRAWNNAKSFMFIDCAFYHYETRHEDSLTYKISFKRILQGLNSSTCSVEFIKNNSKNKKLLQFVSLMSYSLIRRYKELEGEDRKSFIKELKNNREVLNYPYFFSTRLFYIVYKIFGLEFALKFV